MACGSGWGRGIRTTPSTRPPNTRRRSGPPLPRHNARTVGIMADARSLFAPLPARYDQLAEVLSFYQNSRWRSFMVSRLPPASGVILDVAAGTAGGSLGGAGA